MHFYIYYGSQRFCSLTLLGVWRANWRLVSFRKSENETVPITLIDGVKSGLQYIKGRALWGVLVDTGRQRVSGSLCSPIVTNRESSKYC